MVKRAFMKRSSHLVNFLMLLSSSVLFVSSVLADERPAPVNVVKVAKAPLYEEVPLTGSVESKRVSRISPKINGFIAEVLVDEGDEVKAGDPVLHLDPVMAEIEYARVAAQLNEAQAKLNKAERQRDEAAELLKKKNIPATRYESLVSEVKINAAVLERLQTDVRRQKEILERHTVRAPFDGVIGQKLIEAGQWVETGTALFELVEIDVLRIDVPVPQYYFSQIEVGTPVIIQFDAFPDRTMEGAITMKIPVGESSGRTFPVRIEMNNEQRLIAPGMSARVKVRLGTKGESGSLLLPRDAIVKKPDGSSSVWVINEQDGSQVAMPVMVQTGRADRKNIEILEGDVHVGDKVVIRGNEILQSGQSVRITREVELQL